MHLSFRTQDKREINVRNVLAIPCGQGGLGSSQSALPATTLLAITRHMGGCMLIAPQHLCTQAGKLWQIVLVIVLGGVRGEQTGWSSFGSCQSGMPACSDVCARPSNSCAFLFRLFQSNSSLASVYPLALAWHLCFHFEPEIHSVAVKLCSTTTASIDFSATCISIVLAQSVILDRRSQEVGVLT